MEHINESLTSIYHGMLIAESSSLTALLPSLSSEDINRIHKHSGFLHDEKLTQINKPKSKILQLIKNELVIAVGINEKTGEWIAISYAGENAASEPIFNITKADTSRSVYKGELSKEIPGGKLTWYIGDSSTRTPVGDREFNQRRSKKIDDKYDAVNYMVKLLKRPVMKMASDILEEIDLLVVDAFKSDNGIDYLKRLKSIREKLIGYAENGISYDGLAYEIGNHHGYNSYNLNFKQISEMGMTQEGKAEMVKLVKQIFGKHLETIENINEQLNKGV